MYCTAVLGSPFQPAPRLVDARRPLCGSQLRWRGDFAKFAVARRRENPWPTAQQFLPGSRTRQGLPTIVRLFGHVRFRTTAKYAHLMRDAENAAAARTAPWIMPGGAEAAYGGSTTPMQQKSLSNRTVVALTAEQDKVFWNRDHKLQGPGPSLGAKDYIAQGRALEGPKRIIVGRHGVLKMRTRPAGKQCLSPRVSKRARGRWPSARREAQRQPDRGRPGRAVFKEHVAGRRKPRTKTRVSGMLASHTSCQPSARRRSKGWGAATSSSDTGRCPSGLHELGRQGLFAHVPAC